MPFSKKQNQPIENADDGKQLLHDEAVRLVKNQHGPRANKLDNFDDLVADAKNQIQHNIEVNKTF